jgi:hypothetical protein
VNSLDRSWLINRLDLKAYFKSLNIIYQQPALRAEDYLPLGNGDLGILLDPLGANCFGGNVVKSDVWTESHSNLDDPLVDYIPVSQLRALDPVCDADKLWSLARYEEERSDFNRRLIRPQVIGKFQSLLIQDGISPSNVDELKLEEKDEVSLGGEDKTIWRDLQIVHGLRVVLALRVVNAPAILVKHTHGRAYLEFSPKSGEPYYVLVTVATSLDPADPLKQAILNLDKAESKGIERLQLDHERWWTDFWKRSFVSLPGKDIEDLWFSQLYLLASSSRGNRPPGLCMLWPATESWPWVGCYFDMNHSLMYCSAESSNHGELAEPYYRLYEGALSCAKENARRLYGCRGACYPHNMGADGYEIAMLWWRLQLYHSAFAALLFWHHWAFTGNIENLRKRVYPFMKEAGQFYQDYLKLGPEGLYHFLGPNCTINEDNTLNVFRKIDPPFEIALVKRLMNLLLEASELLEVDTDLRHLWRDIYDHLAEPANNTDIFLPWKDEDLRSHTFCVTDTMGPIWPAQTADPNDPRVLNTIIDAVASGCGVQCFSWMWIAAAAATAHMGYAAARCLHGQMLRHQLPSGQFGESGGKGWIHSPQYGRRLPGTLIGESGPAAVAAINQMLLHSLFDGIVEVFPAVPPSWTDCSFFQLRAMGGFLISAARTEGRTKFIVITSLYGQRVRVRMPREWDGNQCIVRIHPSGLEVETKPKNKIISFSTQPNSTYILLPTKDSSMPEFLPLIICDYKLKYVGLPSRSEEQ